MVTYYDNIINNTMINNVPDNNNFGASIVVPTMNNNNSSTKRLASTREDLERSWQLVPQDDSTMQENKTFARGPSLRHCISNDGMTSEEDESYNESRVKRRRTISAATQFTNDNDNMNIMMDEGVSLLATNQPIRISPSTRPKQTDVPIKAGWYEGDIDSNGARHGRGVTKNDDGTEYEGNYVNDVMEGTNGRYQFVTTRHLVPNPDCNGSHLHRHVEKSFVGTFKQDVPTGVGMYITKTVDCAPQVLGGHPLDIRYMEVVYDVGMHKNVAVGEGIRVIYQTTNANGRSTLEMNCYRLTGGETTNTQVASDYAKWIFQCMNIDFPPPPSSSSGMIMS